MITLVLILVTVVLYAIISELRKPAKFKPLYKETALGCTSYPLIGQSYIFAGNSEDRMETFTMLSREAANNKHGVVSFWFGTKFYTLISDPLVLDKIMKTQLEKPDIVKYFRHLLGNVLIFAPVAIWHRRRKVIAPTMSQNNLNRFTRVFSKHSIFLAKIFEEKVGNIFSSVEYFARYSLDTIAENALGVKTNSQGQSSAVKKAFDRYSDLVTARACQPWLHSDAVYKLLPSYAKLNHNKSILNDFVNKAIQKKRNEIKNVTDINQDLIPLLDLMIESSGGDLGYTDTELLEEMLVIFLAGMDTSAVSQGFIAVMLSRYPDIQDKVYDELQNIFGDSDRPVAVEDLPKLTYLDAVIRETLRLYPPAPILVRQIQKETTLPSGIALPVDTNVFISIWGVHRNHRYWGPDADQFRPERFLEGPLTHPCAWMPFSSGPRNCIGYRYAMMSLKTVFATLLRKYRFLPPDMSPEDLRKPLGVKVDVMLRHIDDFPVRLQYRSI